MEGEHAHMWQIPCKMTNSSPKPLQTLGKVAVKKSKKDPKASFFGIVKSDGTWRNLIENGTISSKVDKSDGKWLNRTEND